MDIFAGQNFSILLFSLFLNDLLFHGRWNFKSLQLQEKFCKRALSFSSLYTFLNRYHNWTIYLRNPSEFILPLLYSQSIIPFMISYHLSTLGFYFSCENFNLFLQHVSHSDGAACKWVASGRINHLCLQFLRYFWGEQPSGGARRKD